MLDILLSPNAWLAFLTLVFLEIVLGIDNIIFLSIMSNKAPAEKQQRVRAIGLLGAMIGRISLLFCVSWLMRLTQPLFSISLGWIETTINGQSIIIFLGGLFLLYKSVTEIHHKFDHHQPTNGSAKIITMGIFSVVAQIIALDLVFSIDSVLTAIGMVSFTDFGYAGGMTIMVSAVIISVLVMLFYSRSVSKFVNNNPTIQMLALSFLILIAVTLLVEAGHLANLKLMGTEISEIPKGYIYFAIAFSLMVEVLNIKLKKKNEK